MVGSVAKGLAAGAPKAPTQPAAKAAARPAAKRSTATRRKA
jgi:hypothetical protein